MELAYRVPAGQDRTAVPTALSQEGYDAGPDPTDHQLVRVECPDGARDHVREVVGAVRTSAIDAGVPMDPGPVRFADEQ